MTTVVNKKVKQCRRRRATVKMPVDVDIPAQNTQVQKQKAASKANANTVSTAKGTRETTKTETRISRLMQPTVSFRSKTITEGAMSVEPRLAKQHTSRLMKHMEHLGKKIH